MKGINRTKAPLVLFAGILVFLSVSIALGDINTRMDTFDVTKTRAPIYLPGITEEALIADPTPDTIFSYCVDNWAYAGQVIAWFETATKAFNAKDIQIVVAMADSSFVCAAVDTEQEELHLGYYAQIKDRLIVTEEFLAIAIQYGDTHTFEETCGYVYDFYNVEWYAVYHGRKVPKFVIAIVIGCMVAASALTLRRPK